MAETNNTIDRNLADSIAMLEQILEVMPHDADALKALYSAYCNAGQDEESFDYLSRIVDVYINGGDRSLLPFIQKELERYDTKYPSETAAQKARLRMVMADDTPEAAEETQIRSPEKDSGSEAKEADISEELALAWRLYEENQLSQEEYSSVLHDLTEVSSKELDVPVSVLHVLQDRGFTQMNRILNYLSTRSGVPFINLSGFEFSEDVAQSLPLEIPAHEGALPFAFFGDDVLVATLNPFNNKLVDTVERTGGRRCHTYLVEPEDYDLALGRLKSLADKATPAAQP